MSSQVNKSNVKFKPKVKQRVRRNSTARRSSVTINTTFSTPGDREALKVRASNFENAIEEEEEEDFKAHSVREETLMLPPKGKEELIIRDEMETVSKVESSGEKAMAATFGDEPIESAAIESSQSIENPGEKVDDSSHPALQPLVPAPVQLETVISAPPSPKSLPQNIKGSIPQPVQPILEALVPIVSGPGAQELVLQQKQQQQLVVQEPQGQEMIEVVDEEELSDLDREPVYDKDGRQIIEPRDLRRMGKYNAKIHYHNRVINADTFTMATLCGDVPIGETNEEYYKYEDVRSSRKRNRALLLQAKRMIRGQYQPTTEHKRMQLLRVYKDWQVEREATYGTKRPGVDIDSLEGPAGGSVTQQQPQLTTDSQGRIIVESQSLVVDRHANNKADDDDGGQERVEATKFGDHINSYSFSTKERPERWTSVETDTFYNAVSVWGTDFNLIAQFFPQRTRGQIKTKFKYEERRNPDKLRLYMIHRKKVKLEDVARISGTTIVPAADIEADLEKVRREHAEQMRKETEAREAAAREDAQRKSMDHMRRRQSRGISGSSEVVGELPVKDELGD